MASTDSNQPASPGGDPAGSQPRGATRFFGRRPSLQTPTEALHPDTPPGPPVVPNSKRRPMLSTASGVLSFLLIAAVGGLGFLAYASSRLAEPGPLAADKVVNIPPRTEVSDIVDQLEKAGVIRQAFVMKAALVIDQKWSQVKAGEYMFRQHASLNDVIDTLVSGKAILHSVTIPEGLTSQQIVERLRQNELLTGDILDIPAEGTLLPETYRVLRGQSRASLIRQMRDQQTRELDRIWERRSADIPVRSKIEMLTLASIVEKETGRADERTRVAAVFYNRLRRGMKLQSDPTIVYGIVGGKGTLGRPIQKDEILRPSRYNTYVIPALPPGPIANPGKASLEAVANPSRTNDLFFVANGTGGHSFAESLDQHNRNVLRWREIERERAAARAQQPAAQPAAGDQNDRVAPGAEADPSASPARGRRSDLPGGEVFGAVPEDLAGKSVALAELTGALGAMSGLPQDIPGLNSSPPSVAPVRSAAVQPQKAAVAPSPSALPPSVAAYAPVAAPPPVAAAEAPAVHAGNQPKPAASAFRIGKGVGDLDLNIAGVDTRPSPLDGPVDDSVASGPANMETYPLDATRRNEMNARSAMYGRGAAPAGPVETLNVPQGEAGAVAPGAAPSNAPRRIVDASEGTALDPLRSRGWDLNASHQVPAAMTLPAKPAARPAAAPASGRKKR